MSSGRVDIVFDVTRLFIRASLNAPTGIDRVTEAYGRWLLSRSDINLTPVCTWGGYIWTMSVRQLRDILGREIVDADLDQERWDRLVAALGATAPSEDALRSKSTYHITNRIWDRYVPAILRTFSGLRSKNVPPGAIYINVSHYGLEQDGVLERVVRRGWRPVAFVHDLIPIIHPEYCSPVASKWHRRRIETIVKNAALVIANSNNTAEELATFAKNSGRQAPRVLVAPLGVEDRFIQANSTPISTRPYFVVVGTLEPRKNLTMLFSVWRRLAEEMGDETPNLVLIGQRGWESEAIIDHLERSPPVRRFVHEANGLRDDQVIQLAQGARALLAPSFKEGFDLPVREARALGTPVIASAIPIHREVAPDAQLIDPLDGPAWAEAIKQATADGGPRHRTVARGWAEHFALVSPEIESC